MSRLDRAFTLIELVAVLLLTALLAAAVSVSLKGVRRDAALDELIGQLKAYDAATRDHTRLVGRPTSMRFDLSAGTVVRTDAETRRPEGSTFSLRSGGEPARSPNAVQMNRLLTPDGEAAAGEVDIMCSARGYTLSYAVLFTGPGGRRRWVLFAGLTGEARTMRDDRQVLETLAPLRPAGGDDAD